MQEPIQRVALVTGANRGLGYAIAEQLAELGLKVVIGARDQQKGLKAQDRLVAKGLDVSCTSIDLTDVPSIAAAVERLGDQYGRLDVLVNNAGILVDGEATILGLPLGVLHNTLQTNAIGALLLSQGCVPIMRRHRYGRIVNVSSTMGSLTEIADPQSATGDLGSPAYRLSKILLNGITTLLARELRGQNILVNSVCPGWVRTDLGGPRAPLAPEQAARTPVWLATLPEGGPTGGFFREQGSIPW